MADQESQIWPLAPAKLYTRSDENPKFKVIRQERSNKCFVYVFAAIGFNLALILVFAMLIIRVKSSEIKLQLVNVTSLKYTTSPPSFIVSLSAEMSVKNPNFGDFEFTPSTVSFLYSRGEVGSTKIARGEIKKKKTARLSLGVDLRSSKLPEGANTLKDDVNSGVVKLTGTGKVSGRVTLWKIINKRKTGKMDCAMSLVLKSKTIKDMVCT